MKLILSTLSIFIFFGFTSLAQDSDPFAPIIKFDRDTVNLGTIKKGADGNFEMSFKNTGRSTLEIESITSECACIVTKEPKKAIKKGKAGVIKGAYYTQRPGPINKTITIKSNVSGGITILTIIGNVEGT